MFGLNERSDICLLGAPDNREKGCQRRPHSVQTIIQFFGGFLQIFLADLRFMKIQIS